MTSLAPPEAAGGPEPGDRDGTSRCLASWSGRSVTVGAVLGALDDLRRSQARTATRTSVVNLVVAATHPAGAERAAAAMRRLGHRHPGRTLALVCRPQGPEGLDARVDLHQATAEGHNIWWEEIRLELGGRLCHHVDSLVSPLLLGELPMAAWFPSILPAPGDPLAAMADAVLVDARWATTGDREGEGEEEVFGALPALVELSRRHAVVDLSWKRLTPWRALLSGLFDPTPLRPFVAGVTSAEVAGHAGPSRLLAGWLVDRLALPARAVADRRAVHATISLDATHGGRRGRFVVSRTSDEPVVQARAEIEGGPAQAETTTLPEHGLTWSLAEALVHLGHDVVYDHAIHAALSLA